MVSYNKESYEIPIGINIKTRQEECLEIPRGGWSTIASNMPPRMGKSANAKHVAVLTSKIRKVCIFDYNGEWKDHVIYYSPSPLAKYKEKLTDYKILSNIGFTISEMITDSNVLASLGFTEQGSDYITLLAQEGYDYYEDNPEKFGEMVNKLPYREDQVDWYKQEFGVELPGSLHSSTVQSIRNRYLFIKKWFYNPKNPGQDLNYYDIQREFLTNEHLIVEFNLRNEKNRNRAMAICGYYLKKLREIQDKTKASYFIEETRQLLPALDIGIPDAILPSSVKQIYDMITLDPKHSCSVFLIMQSEQMIYKQVLDHIFIRVLGRDAILERKDLQKLIRRMNLRWNPNKNYRELVLWYRSGKITKIIPYIACCRV